MIDPEPHVRVRVAIRRLICNFQARATYLLVAFAGSANRVAWSRTDFPTVPLRSWPLSSHTSRHRARQRRQLQYFTRAGYAAAQQICFRTRSRTLE